MKLMRARLWNWLAVLLLAGICAGRAAEIDITQVTFGVARSPVDGGEWYEAVIVLNANPVDTAGRYVSRVKLTLNLGEETGVGPGKSFVFYRSSVEMAAVEQGRAAVRFYLPPEVVKRDRIHGDMKFYAIDLEVGGKALPPGRGSLSSGTITNEEALKAFKQHIEADAPANDGILLPQYLTPFVLDANRTSPSFIRK